MRIAQQREKSRDYFEKHRLEILKKRKQLFNETLDGTEDDDDDESRLKVELDNSHCKHCFKPFKNLRGLWSHIAQMVPCRKFYGEDSLEEMKHKLAEVSPKKLKRSKRFRSGDKDDDDDEVEDLKDDLDEPAKKRDPISR